ncbi:uncharacterized protein [Epargyreus clarus]|uniref:uncharacterized protein n=1 Tax=Epargyreus clarus TaxID=520877 RepID=UPI003C2D08C8
MHSEERQNRLIEMNRSFEDIPASPYKVKSRRASLAVHNETYAQSLALFVLKESYKGMDDISSGNPAPQIKKLQKTFSFKNFDDVRESGKSSAEDLREYGDTDEFQIKMPVIRKYMSSEDNSENELMSPLKNRLKTTFTFTTYDDVRDSDRSSMENLDEMGNSYERRMPMRRRRVGINSGNLLSPLRKRTFSFKSNDDVRELDKSSVENLDDTGSDTPNLKNNVPITKTISFEDQRDRPDDRKVETKGPRQRRVGVIASPPLQNLLEIREESSKKPDLRKEILIRQNLSHFKSCEELITRKKGKVPRSGSVETVLEPIPSTSGIIKKGKDQSSNISSNIRKLKRNFKEGTARTFTETKERVLPTIVISDADSPVVESIIVKDENITPTNASNIVNLSSTCDCRICSEDEIEDGMSFLRRNLKNLFIKIVSCRDYGRKLTYWDENNNLDENEMYNCVMHVLKLMFGLWLRHLDHN